MMTTMNHISGIEMPLTRIGETQQEYDASINLIIKERTLWNTIHNLLSPYFRARANSENGSEDIYLTNLAGGIYIFPTFGVYEQILLNIAQILEQSGLLQLKHWFLCEYPTTYSPFVMDIDAKLPSTTENMITDDGVSFIQKIMRVVHEIVEEFYPSDISSSSSINDKYIAYVTMTSAELLPDIQRIGAHVYFPDLIVDVTRAIKITRAIVCRLDLNNPEYELPRPSEPWCSIIDASVVTSNSLRMIFMEKCSICSKKTHKLVGCSCVKINGKKYMNHHRVYRPKFVCIGKTILQKETEEFINPNKIRNAFQKTTRRRADNISLTNGYNPPRKCPIGELDYATEEDYKKHAKKQKLMTIDDGLRTERKSKLSLEVNVLPEIKILLQSYIQNLCSQWSHILIRSIKKEGKSGKILINVYGEGANFCTNKKDYHHRSNIYFTIQQNDKKIVTLKQGCFSRKPPNIGNSCSCFDYIKFKDNYPSTITDKTIINALFITEESPSVSEPENVVIIPRPPPLLHRTLTPMENQNMKDLRKIMESNQKYLAKQTMKVNYVNGNTSFIKNEKVTKPKWDPSSLPDK